MLVKYCDSCRFSTCKRTSNARPLEKVENRRETYLAPPNYSASPLLCTHPSAFLAVTQNKDYDRGDGHDPGDCQHGRVPVVRDERNNLVAVTSSQQSQD